MRISDWSSDVCSSDLGRTQQIIYQIHQLARQGRLEHPKVFVDSPMATDVTRITRQHLRLFDEQARALADWHARGRDLLWLPFTASVEESMALINIARKSVVSGKRESVRLALGGGRT